MDVYRVVLDIAGLKVYDVGMKITNRQKGRYNDVEIFMDNIRKELNCSFLPRKGATYVCFDMESARHWYTKIDASQKLNYFVYKLKIEGCIQWHDSRFYENVFSMYSSNKESCPVMLRYYAFQYWLSSPKHDLIYTEGLFWGNAVVLERKHYNFMHEEIKP